MRIIVTKYQNCFEVCVRSEAGINEAVYTFDDKKQVEAFCSGFSVAKTIANNLIQSMPIGYVWAKDSK